MNTARSNRFTLTWPLSMILVLVLGGATTNHLEAQKGGGASPAQSAGGSSQGTQGGATPYFETIMEAYGAMNQLSESITWEVCDQLKNGGDSGPVTIVIFDPTSFQNVAAWQSFSSTAEALKNAYETMLTTEEVDKLFPPPATPEVGTLASIPITSASDLAGLITALSSSTTNTASTFTIQDSAMAVSLAHQFQRQKQCKVNVKYYPLFGSYVDLSTTNIKVQAALADLNKLRTYIQHTAMTNTSVQYLLLSDLNAQYDLLLRSISSGAAQGGQTTSANSQPGAPGSSSSNVPQQSQSGAAGLVSLEQGAALNELLTNKNTYVLYADVVAAGGTQRDRKNIVTLITGDWISYSGGVIVNVALVRSADTVLKFADTLRYRVGFAHMKNPRESQSIENTNAGENELSVCGGEMRLHWWQKEKSAKPCENSAERKGSSASTNPPSTQQ
jgi:hypothetical protein